MPAIHLTYPEPDIALLTMDLPNKGANVLSRSFIEELREHFTALREAEAEREVVAAVAEQIVVHEDQATYDPPETAPAPRVPEPAPA